MKLADYIDTAKLAQHIKDGYVMERHHKEWPLVMYTYARRCQYENHWDDTTSRCRGLIVNKDTGDVVARPFEKFHNIGTTTMPDTWPENLPNGEPAITKKLDGNLITLYPWEGHWYAASKGSFHSEHADWANQWLAGLKKVDWPAGYTPVCEMIAESVQHHVVHYGEQAQGLYLLALINNETGEELPDQHIQGWYHMRPLDLRMEAALKADNKNEEGYVLAWAQAGQPPFRVKVKFVEFLRLQKLLHNTGPKQILDMLRYPHLKCYLDEALDVERSTPKFVEWVKGWISKLRNAYIDHYKIIEGVYQQAKDDIKEPTVTETRKAYALQFTAPENKQYSAALFSRMDGDGEKLAQQLWKLVEPMTEGNRPFTTEEE